MDDIICLILIFYFDLKTHEMVNATSTRTVSLKLTSVFVLINTNDHGDPGPNFCEEIMVPGSRRNLPTII
jgi:hypothetical protein